MTSATLTLTQPDDWHLHLRDGIYLGTTVPHSARVFGRAIVMPNLVPPVVNVDMARAYRERILAAVPGESSFDPHMALYLTDSTTPDMVQQATADPHIAGFKLYPAGATTNSDSGVTDLGKLTQVLEAMQKAALPLLIHGEVTDPDVDIFDREKVFIDNILQPICHQFPALRIVLEHITTADAVQFVEQAPANVAATITVHHLLFDRNNLLAGGIRPHFYCLPVLKRSVHRSSLVKAATSGNSKFFFGTDSAPHGRQGKETDCGCAGIYSSPAALELCAEVFEQENALHKMEAFTSFHGADFYGLPRNESTVTLVKEQWKMAKQFDFGTDEVVPIRAGEPVAWKLKEGSSLC